MRKNRDYSVLINTHTNRKITTTTNSDSALFFSSFETEWLKQMTTTASFKFI